MKKIFPIALVCLSIFLLGTGCKQATNPYHSPKSITKAYAESLYSGDFAQAKTFVTPESIPIINFFQHAFPPEHFEGCEHLNVSEINVKETSDSTAICKFSITLCNGRNDKGVANVVKREGKWFVTLRQSKAEKEKEEQEQFQKMTVNY